MVSAMVSTLREVDTFRRNAETKVVAISKSTNGRGFKSRARNQLNLEFTWTAVKPKTLRNQRI
jgi:hypothetical protein